MRVLSLLFDTLIQGCTASSLNLSHICQFKMCVTIADPATPPSHAFVTIFSHNNENSVTGDVEIIQNTKTSPLVVKGSVKGLTPGKHGIHVHAKEIEGQDCQSAGGHYDPERVRFLEDIWFLEIGHQKFIF